MIVITLFKCFKKFPKILKTKPPNNSGFSLIELLVVIGVLSILAAFAIPSYNEYKEKTHLSVFHSTGSNIVKAFASCTAVKPFKKCDTLHELNIQCEDCFNTAGQAPHFCVSIRKEVAGSKMWGCYEVNVKTGAVASTFNESLCYNDDGVASQGRLETRVIHGLPPDTVAYPLTRCISHTDCRDAGAGRFCNNHNQTTGRCVTNKGQCS